ncbi:hypothetical protein GCM10009856_33600 [Mycolicibacterium llatzerense]
MAAAFVVCSQLTVVAPAHADASATVKVRTQRMTDANLGSGQDGWYNAGDRVTLTCWKRGQPVKGYFSFNIPNGGWDNLWYRSADNHYVADVDIETGTLQPVGPDCGALGAGGGAPAPEAAPTGTPGRAMGDKQSGNSAVGGQCTWGALEKWHGNAGYYPDLDGNALSWANSARNHHWTVVDDAQPRSIVVFRPGLPDIGANGHVAWVNSVSQRSDGRWINITEMNNIAHGGEWSWWTRDVKDIPGMSYILMP